MRKSVVAQASRAGDVLDEAVFASIRALSVRLGPDIDNSIVQLFLRDAEMRIGELKRLLILLDAPGIAACAHSLRGSAGMVGARQMMNVSREIDKLAQDDCIEPIKPLIVRLENEFERAKRAMA